MNVLIADDHPIMRQGLKNLIAAESAFDVIAETGNGDEAMELLEQLRPDLAVVDISMPGKSGLDLVRESKKLGLETQFVILTMFREEEYFDAAMDCGVKGYLLKENAAADLRKCLKAVAAGKRYVSSDVSDYLFDRQERKKQLQAEIPGLKDLTQMEKQILKLIAENKTSRDIASELFISHRTVQNHRNNICQKLGFKGYNKLLRFALENKSSLTTQ